MKKIFTFLLLACTTTLLFAQTAPDKYWLQFTDKDDNGYSIDKPEEFLSSRAIERRTKQSISIDEKDLPIKAEYITNLQNLGLKILNKSKWFNAVTVYTTDKALIDTIEKYSYIKSKNKVAKYNYKRDVNINAKSKSSYSLNEYMADYGVAAQQIAIHNGQVLHNNGYYGQGMHIAIMDGGFTKVNTHKVFDSLHINNRILGTLDFVQGDENVYESSDHGTKVLSIMGGNVPGQFVGVAPRAKYWLFKTEDGDSEYTIEEDNWVSAAEFADSAGVDVANTSLGYAEFDDISQNYTYSDLDGNHARISIAAEIATSKGMLIVVSAGNSGNKPWRYITPPADADNIITVGAIDYNSTLVAFSSVGPTSDGRIKPEVCAVGYQTMAASTSGTYEQSNGTSFSSPIICGLSAVLWQVFPNKTNLQIRKLILQSSSQYNSPDNNLGYGIPDFQKASSLTNILNQDVSKSIEIYPNPFNSKLHINLNSGLSGDIKIEIIDLTGKIIYKQLEKNPDLNSIQVEGLDFLSKGLYFIKISNKTQSFSKKVIKY